MGYSQALETQLGLLDFMQSHGQRYMRLVGGERGVRQDSCDWISAVIQDTLEIAEPYYWSPEMCDLLAGISPTMPAWTLRATDFLSRAGFMYFSTPIPLPSLHDGGVAAPLAGIGWWIIPAGEQGAARTAIVLSVFASLDGCGMRPFMAAPFHDGAPMQGFLDDVATVGPDYDADTLSSAWNAIGTAITLCNQRIIKTSSERPERHTRKRASVVWQHEPLIRVVRLRRTAQPSPADRAGEPVAWSCRWVVSGHWRQQFYPSSGEHHPIWVLPYIKGPEEMPLKAPRAKVFEVVR